eukprot:GEZU01017898.1.p1 GENE.GEZU01017898.1~~GEZU01017898.1.p1  ORF type:complete len:244 (-),score=58.40 GEZU01017898.1:284-1015(-)
MAHDSEATVASGSSTSATLKKREKTSSHPPSEKEEDAQSAASKISEKGQQQSGSSGCRFLLRMLPPFVTVVVLFVLLSYLFHQPAIAGNPIMRSVGIAIHNAIFPIYKFFAGKAAASVIGSRAAPRYYTKAELAKYDGTDPKLPILLAFKGKVYDVTNGAQHYGPDGGYHFFAGRDATRAFVTGCFTEECLTDNLDGLTEQQLHDVDEWAKFYDETYKFVGYIKPPPPPPPPSPNQLNERKNE